MLRDHNVAVNKPLLLVSRRAPARYGAELAARIADQLFDELDAPVKRIAATDTFCAYQPKLEDAILPQSDSVVAAVKKLVEY